MDTKIHIQLGFKIADVFFGWDNGILYQLPYTNSGRYFGLRVIKQKTTKANWRYYHIRRKKIGIEKLRAITEPVNWSIKKPENIL